MIPLLMLFLGCADPSDDSGTPAPAVPSFAEIQATVFVRECGGPGCHGASTAAGGLDLESTDAYAALVQGPCDNADAEAAGLLRVAPGDPQRSFLYVKITDPAGMGDAMPPWGPLSADAVRAIGDWIAAGAPEG